MVTCQAGRLGGGKNRDGVTLHLSEADVERLLSPADAVAAIEACFHRLAAGGVENKPRYRLRARARRARGDGGRRPRARLRGREGVREASRAARASSSRSFAPTSPELVAVIDADKLGQLRTGAASAVAAKHLARPGATTLGVIGCGWQAETQVACIRAAVPGIERVVAYCRTESKLREFCERNDCEPGESHRDPGECDIVVTVTGSPDPVLRGEWLQRGRARVRRRRKRRPAP